MRTSLLYRLRGYRYILSSLRFNIHYLGWKQGLKLPIMFYCPVKFRNLEGKVIINAPLKKSLISIGLPGNEMFDYNTPCIWTNQGGIVEFHGTFGTNAGMSFVVRKDAYLSIGEHTSFGVNLRILCSKSINIGNNILGSWDVTIMDTDSHYFETGGRVSKFSDPVNVGNHCFIGSGVNILKGSLLPDGAVIATKAVVTGKLAEPYAMYAGIPATQKKHNIKYLR